MIEQPKGKVSRRQALRITAAAGLSLTLGGGLTAALLSRARVHRVSATRVQMGTPVTVTVMHPDASAARAMVNAAFAEIGRLEKILSRHDPGTPVARLNREGILRNAPAELIEVLGRSIHFSYLTGGAFDSTVAPLLALYRSRFQRTGLPPAEAEVNAALTLVDYRHLHIDDTVITFTMAGMSITLDGIAKGYVVDRAVAVLVLGGAEHVMVNAGGDIASAGDGAADDWRVGIQDPRKSGEFIGLVRLRGECVATSGDYIQTFNDDRSIHHILDPRTGRSPDHTSAVTVVAGSAMDADALSTAVFVLGPDDGLRLLDQQRDCEGVIVTKQQERVTTRGFSRYVG
jgi:FAD:protein FMN transferase